MNILTALLALWLSSLAFLELLVPFYVHTFGASAATQLQALCPVLLLYGLLLCAALWALSECAALLVASWAVLRPALHHALRPGLPCASLACDRCWPLRAVVLGPSSYVEASE